MNQKEYELIAGHFKNELGFYDPDTYGDGELEPYEVIKSCAIGMAAALESEYTNFDRTKFLTACGIDTTVRTSDGRKVVVTIEETK